MMKRVSDRPLPRVHLRPLCTIEGLAGEEIAELLDRYSGVLQVDRDDFAVDR